MSAGIITASRALQPCALVCVTVCWRYQEFPVLFSLSEQSTVRWVFHQFGVRAVGTECLLFLNSCITLPLVAVAHSTLKDKMSFFFPRLCRRHSGTLRDPGVCALQLRSERGAAGQSHRRRGLRRRQGQAAALLCHVAQRVWERRDSETGLLAG